MVVVLLYDHLLTVGDEVTYVWTPRLKQSSGCFLLFRYFALLSNLTMVAFFLMDLGPEICKKLSTTENYLLVIQEIFVGCVLSLRVCAMYGFNRQIFLCLAIAILTAIGLGAWAVIGPEDSLDTTLLGCHVVTTRPQAIRVAAAWEGQLICDILILALTLRRAFTDHRAGGLESGSLLRMMVRDGALYFAMICMVNLANIIQLYVSIFSPMLHRFNFTRHVDARLATSSPPGTSPGLLPQLR